MSTKRTPSGCRRRGGGRGAGGGAGPELQRNPQVVIPFEEIERFKEEFVSLFLLARGSGKHMPVLLRELRAQGIQPVGIRA